MHIAKNNNYDVYSTPADALTAMRQKYGGSSWHYTDAEIDLHHALLGKYMGGGSAYVATLCIPQAGFGVSTGIRGNFVSMDASTLWDVLVVLHEIGRVKIDLD